MAFITNFVPADAIAGASFTKAATPTVSFATLWQANANAGQLTFNVYNTSAATITIRITRFSGSQDDYLIEVGDTRSFTVPDAEKLLVQTSTTVAVAGQYVIVD